MIQNISEQIIEIDFDRVVNFGALGRNGWSKVQGWYIMRDGLEIQINPVNTKGDVTKCFLRIPLENIQELIDTLQKFKL